MNSTEEKKKYRKRRKKRYYRMSVTNPNKLVIYADDKYIPLEDAAKIANVHLQTIRNWCRKFGIGKKVKGKYHVYPERLKEFMDKQKKDPPYSGDRIKGKYCPHGYHFGIDFDEKKKCEKCNEIIWLRCGRKNEKHYFAKQALNRTNKLYTEKQLEKKIKEMEERLD